MAIAATIDAPSCMAPQVIPSTAHPAASAQIETAGIAALASSPVVASVAVEVPHYAPSSHPLSALVESHPSPILARAAVPSPASSPSAVSAAVHVTSSFVVASTAAFVNPVAGHERQRPADSVGVPAVAPAVPIHASQFKAALHVQSANTVVIEARSVAHPAEQVATRRERIADCIVYYLFKN
jgi:hypothetical protein